MMFTANGVNMAFVNICKWRLPSEETRLITHHSSTTDVSSYL